VQRIASETITNRYWMCTLSVGIDRPMTNLQFQPVANPGDVTSPRRISLRNFLATTTDGLDLPTLGVALAVYGGYIALTWFYRDLPIWIAAPLCAVWLTWHGSLQHETIHDHPTPSRRLNSMLAGPPLSLWLPYRLYRATHLQHHRHGGRYLTEVSRDPESFFMRPGTLSSAGSLRCALYLANCTLAGRLAFGPALAVWRFWATEMRKALGGDRRCRKIWARHGVGMAIVLLWTAGVCHIPVAVYVMFMVYPSMSLSHLRSFAEHRADQEPTLRTMAVEAHPVWALIFLNNNLHIAHHAHPTLPWHQLPRMWNHMRDSAIGSGLVFHRGYRQVVDNYLLRPVISVEHPGKDGFTQR
jgi:fatty acid desaturase